VCAAFFGSERQHGGHYRLDPRGRIQSQQGSSGGDALMHLLEEPRITHLVLHEPFGILLRGRASHAGLLGWLLRSLPSGPSLTLEAVQLLQLDPALRIKIPNRRGSPLGLDAFQIPADGSLRDLQMLGDRGLRPTLQVEIGDLLATLYHEQRTAGVLGHAKTPAIPAFESWNSRAACGRVRPTESRHVRCSREVKRNSIALQLKRICRILV
jgi:hypothetical protein